MRKAGSICNWTGTSTHHEGSTKLLKKTLWFLRRPQFYPHMLYLALKKVVPGSKSKDKTRAEATRWCESRALETNDAISKLTGLADPKPVRELFPSQMKWAYHKARECPVDMGGPGNVDLIFWLAEHKSARRVVETGIAYGWSSLAILLSIDRRDGAMLVSTDMPFIGLNNEPYVGCVVPPELRAKWQIIRLADRPGLARALQETGKIDLCHYDSDKSYAGRMWAYPKLWAALTPGGFMISDDVSDNVGFRDFSLAVGREPVVVACDGKFVGVLVK
jgi:hypothetical protein